MSQGVVPVPWKFPRRPAMHAECIEDKHVLAQLAPPARRDRRKLSLGINHDNAVRHLQQRLHDHRRALAAAGGANRDEMAVVGVAWKAAALTAVTIGDGEVS